MRTYLLAIKLVQNIFLGISIILLTVLPVVLLLYPDVLNMQMLYTIAHTSLFFVMIIRPLSDILLKVRFLRPLVILRKGVGVFSASIIVSFVIMKLIVGPDEYLGSLVTSGYWTLQNFALFAHLADISAILLLVTSNNLSKKVLGANWKRIQRLSYVYFYGSGIYVFFVLNDYLVLLYLVIVTILTLWAYALNRQRRLLVHQQ